MTSMTSILVKAMLAKDTNKFSIAAEKKTEEIIQPEENTPSEQKVISHSPFINIEKPRPFRF
ncbi:MAG: hypothetical protein HXY49_03925 [Ignavibacteriaceae bacterium]|jgi:hypothetical protein|nr:hypothetical protein [Ignavibacteriaceae bacterium]